jgi:hypothetical protein
MDFQTIDPHSNSLIGLKSSSPLSVGGYATICNFMKLICKYMQLYANYNMQLYATVCNNATYATILQQFRMQLYGNMQLYATCNLCNLSNFMELMQLYATLCNMQLYATMQLMHLCNLCNYMRLRQLYATI